MARHVRVEYPGAIHLLPAGCLGDARSRLFKDDADYKYYLLEKRLNELKVSEQLLKA